MTWAHHPPPTSYQDITTVLGQCTLPVFVKGGPPTPTGTPPITAAALLLTAQLTGYSSSLATGYSSSLATAAHWLQQLTGYSSSLATGYSSSLATAAHWLTATSVNNRRRSHPEGSRKDP